MTVLSILSANGLCCRPGPHVEVGPLTFSSTAGGILAVRGESGTGKSTLLRTVAGLLAPSTGQVLLDGQSIQELFLPKYRSQVMYVAQEPVFFSGSVRTNLQRGFAYQTHDSTYEETTAIDWMKSLGLDRLPLDSEATQLSVGQKQRVSLIRALLLEPSFLLLDEPTSALDAASTELVENFLLQHVRQGLGLVWVTHSDAQSDRVADQTVTLGHEARQ